MRENQGVRIVEMFSCGTIQIVKFLLAGDTQRHDLGPHAAHEVQTDSATGWPGGKSSACARTPMSLRPASRNSSGRRRPMNGSAPTAWTAVMKISSNRSQAGLAG